MISFPVPVAVEKNRDIVERKEIRGMCCQIGPWCEKVNSVTHQQPLTLALGQGALLWAEEVFGVRLTYSTVERTHAYTHTRTHALLSRLGL